MHSDTIHDIKTSFNRQTVVFIYLFIISAVPRSRSGRAVTRLVFLAEDPGSIPGSFHYIYPSYSSSSVGWGRKMATPCIGAVLQARKRTRVAVVEFHVSLYPISVSPFFPLYTR